jgi:hypothetical protein
MLELALAVGLVAYVGTPRWVPRRPLDAAGLQALITEVRAEHFDGDKLTVLSRAMRTRWFSVTQASNIIPLFEWRVNRLEALRLLVPWLSDRDWAATLLSLFPDDRAEAARILAGEE